MAIKKKVTYSVSYVAGTDTLTTKLNSLLQDIVTLILSQNTGLQILDTITVGSARWTGAPLYDTYNSKLYAAQYQNRHYESDVVFIGTNEDNVCLSLGFFDGCLVVAMNMTPKVEAEYAADWTSVYGLNASTYLPLYATGKQSRWWTRNANAGKYFLPYRIINNTISMSVLYWNTEYSRGYSFINGAGESDWTDLVIFPTDEGGGQTGLGAAIWDWGTIADYHNQTRPGITVFSFAENLSDNKPDSLSTSSSLSGHIQPNSPALLNSNADWRCWGNAANNSASGIDYYKEFQALHFYGGSDGGTEGDYGYKVNMLNLINKANAAISPDNKKRPIPDDDKSKYFASALIMPYNLPYLQPGQAYIRKMRIPGWNPDCKGEIYLLWSPVTSAYQSGDIVEVGSKSYAIITEGAVCWAARVS
jgi:hypothetical protein